MLRRDTRLAIYKLMRKHDSQLGETPFGAIHMTTSLVELCGAVIISPVGIGIALQTGS